MLKVVNLKEFAADAAIVLPDNFRAARISATVLTGELTDRNTLDEPERIVPKHTTLKPSPGPLTYTFPGYSFTVLRFEK